MLILFHNYIYSDICIHSLEISIFYLHYSSKGFRNNFFNNIRINIIFISITIILYLLSLLSFCGCLFNFSDFGEEINIILSVILCYFPLSFVIKSTQTISYKHNVLQYFVIKHRTDAYTRFFTLFIYTH